MKNKKTIPPKWADRFLEWYCKPSLFEDLQGDLYEHFYRHIEDKGIRKAKLIFVLNVFKFFKPYTVKKLNFLNKLTQFIMFKNYFKTSFRSIARNKLFSFINVFGLAVSMSVCLLMITLLTEVKSYEKFHADASDIYRATNLYQYLEEEPNLFASTSIIAGKRIKEEIAGVEAATIMRRNFAGDFENDNQKFALRGIWADESFFDVFSFEVIYGDKDQALTNPKSLVITDETALKIFNQLNVVGETLLKGDEPYQVTAVVKTPPFNSHIKFEVIGSFSTLDQAQMQRNATGWLSWQNMWMNYTYFKVADGQSIKNIQAALDKISIDQNSREKYTSIQLGAQPILKIMTGPQISNSLGMNMGSETLWILGILSFVVILSAGFNYTNLSIARSLRRAKEVGIRKVVGAKRGQIFSQFTVEACIISIFSLILAYGGFLLIKPLFLSLNPEMSRMLQLKLEPITIIYFVLFAILVGFAAGLLPSLVLSKLKAIQVLKTTSNTKLFSSVSLRKALIVIQFTLTLGFIISANVAYNQFKYSVNFDKGFNGENIITIGLAGNDPEQVKTLFERIPEVEQISMAAMVLGTGERWGDDLKYKDPLDSTTIYYSSVDQNYIPMLKHNLIAGSNFLRTPTSDNESEIIVNETLLKRFNIGTPQEAIGEQVLVGSNKLTIIGVVEDFHYAPINEPIESFGFRQNLEDIQLLNLKVNSTNLVGTMDKLRAAWEGFDEVHPFESRFHSEHIARAYDTYELMFTIVTFLAFVSISIACLGLLGMGVYTAETRMKEISIRKVLGASESSLIQLLVKGFMYLLLIAAVIAIPATYYLFDSIILADQANRISIGLNEMGLGVLFIFCIGFLTISSQVWKAAKANPSSTLRSE
ncbi:ABC transporter permease [Roseivirga spongicola]|uniref:ABC3 transporter permease protein domain-containing protein n=1 Tax=Roseivirga spongicola TaxID=333140 RepID=A0A150X983_9BACT|nr:ABC transporter permease [Roseivirga spongicola]KYG75246.1 hypothetical protein AWW68_10590 [Roseivirga spongicola]WPZ08603.1 ABC transporter permease [Roseivirga spongicola]